ncbi:MAG: hypothetical protein HQK66_15585, partial [Desulfamplus sp.]|nr:hypothetical protein [Desulfamplus sp.]
EYLYNSALKSITRRSMSTVLLGQRRMGKTEIFKRVVNRLFFEQEYPDDPNNCAIPVYYSFRDTIIDPGAFAVEYIENFLRWVAAFRLRDSNIAFQESLGGGELVSLVKSRLTETVGIKEALKLLELIKREYTPAPEKKALWLPRRMSDWEESTIVMFLDEFQNTRLPQYRFDIVGMMQEAVESPTCPHFVTGSAMTILASEILGRGSLFGRFRSKPIGPMTDFWGAELALKSAAYYQAVLPHGMAPVVSARCGGNPFYITAVVQQSVELDKPLVSEERINEVLAVDLSSGFIWAELHEQVTRWIERINEHGITKWVLYLSALEEGDRIDLNRIQQELRDKDGREVSLETIRDILIKLSRGDLLEFMELGNWFRKVDDPILLEFLKVWGRITVEGKLLQRVQNQLVKDYQRQKRQIAYHKGYLGEVYMAQILWNSQNTTLPGRFFHSKKDIPVPWRFSYIWHRTSLGEATGLEIDVEAAAGQEMWICESKWIETRKVGVEDVELLLKKARLLHKKEDGITILRLWFFAWGGFTDDATLLMEEKEILWSDAWDLNMLLDHVGLKRLPVLGQEI